MHRKEIERVLRHLPTAELRRVLWKARFIWLRHKISYIPLLVRTAFWHGPVAFAVLIAFPPPPKTPPIAIPIIWFASYCVTVIVCMVLEGKPKYPPAHWVR